MLLAIDIGNTHSVFGLWDGRSFRGVWRRETSAVETEDQLAVWLKGLFDLSGLPFLVQRAICASVVPAANEAVERLCRKWLGVTVVFLQGGEGVGLPVSYEPKASVGADRIANALGALARYSPPIIVVDFGTAITFDTVDGDGTYVGGAIMPGVDLSARALALHTAKLPPIELALPPQAIGRDTRGALQSGIVRGFAGAADALVKAITDELGGTATVLATGGHGELFSRLCDSIQSYEPTLTLEGLVIAADRIIGMPAPAGSMPA